MSKKLRAMLTGSYAFVVSEAILLVALTMALVAKSIYTSADAEGQQDTKVASNDDIDSYIILSDDSVILDDAIRTASVDIDQKNEDDGELIDVDAFDIPAGSTYDPEAEIRARLSSMSVRDKVAMLCLPTAEALTGDKRVVIAGNVMLAALQEFPVSGIVFSERSFKDSDQVSLLMHGADRMVRERTRLEPFLCVASEDADDQLQVFMSISDDLSMIISLMGGSSISLIHEDSHDVEHMGLFWSLGQEFPSDLLALRIADELLYTDLSNIYISDIRDRMGYSGVIITEPVVSGSDAIEAISSGADMVYITSDLRTVYNALLDGVENGMIAGNRLDEAVTDILRIKLLMGKGY